MRAACTETLPRPAFFRRARRRQARSRVTRRAPCSQAMYVPDASERPNPMAHCNTYVKYNNSLDGDFDFSTYRDDEPMVLKTGCV